LLFLNNILLNKQLYQVQNNILEHHYNAYQKNFRKLGRQFEEVFVYMGSTLDTIGQMTMFGPSHQLGGVLRGETHYPRLFIKPSDAHRYDDDGTIGRTRYLLLAKFMKLESDTNDNERGYYLCKDEMTCLPIYVIKYKYD
jgi:hypothetical protein